MRTTAETMGRDSDAVYNGVHVWANRGGLVMVCSDWARIDELADAGVVRAVFRKPYCHVDYYVTGLSDD